VEAKKKSGKIVFVGGGAGAVAIHPMPICQITFSPKRHELHCQSMSLIFIGSEMLVEALWYHYLLGQNVIWPIIQGLLTQGKASVQLTSL
jgi:hypothetical protein